MAKKRSLADAETEIAALRAQLAAASAGGGEAGPIQRFPCVMYRKARVTEKNPNGYEARRVKAMTVVDGKEVIDDAACEAQVAAMEQAGWLHSPETLAVS